MALQRIYCATPLSHPAVRAVRTSGRMRALRSESSHGNNKEESRAHKWCLVVIGSSDHLSWQRSLNRAARFDPDLKEPVSSPRLVQKVECECKEEKKNK